MLTLAGRSALVTGGGRGIGRAISLTLARLGARVCVNYQADAAAAEETVARVREAGGDAFALRADVSRPSEAEGLVGACVRRFGRLDVLVVNHGIWKRAPIERMTPEEWDEMLRVNLTGAYAVCRHAAPHMIARRAGNMILIASTAGQRGEALHAHYAATKGALLAFTSSLAAELAPHGIRVNAVAPGWVMTDMSRDALQGAEGPAALARIPLGRPGTAEEIAGPVAFLASDLSSYVWGQVLNVNGGAVMT
jgi:3-oxoacyl-[acyl-carrier protein] reductase